MPCHAMRMQCRAATVVQKCRKTTSTIETREAQEQPRTKRKVNSQNTNLEAVVLCYICLCVNLFRFLTSNINMQKLAVKCGWICEWVCVHALEFNKNHWKLALALAVFYNYSLMCFRHQHTYAWSGSRFFIALRILFIWLSDQMQNGKVSRSSGHV